MSMPNTLPFDHLFETLPSCFSPSTPVSNSNANIFLPGELASQLSLLKAQFPSGSFHGSPRLFTGVMTLLWYSFQHLTVFNALNLLCKHFLKQGWGVTVVFDDFLSPLWFLMPNVDPWEVCSTEDYSGEMVGITHYIEFLLYPQ